MTGPKAEDVASSPQATVVSYNDADPRSIRDEKDRPPTDEELLANLGYKQELKRDFGHLELFGMSFSIIGVVQGIA